MHSRLKPICVDPEASLRQTIEAINDGGFEIALMVDERECLLGTISDGDVRRALLAGATLDNRAEPWVQRRFTSVPCDADRTHVLDLMQARSISQVPVLENGVVIGMHFLRELLGAVERRNIAVVMAGGRGTRLRPLTEDRPKPLMPVAGRPILERIVLHLTGAGVRTIYLAVNYLAEMIESHFGDGESFGCRIQYLREDPDRPLGTAGALALLPANIRASGEPLLVMNGDLVTQFNVGRFLEAHAAGGGVATIGVREYVHQVPFGVISIDGGRVKSLDEKPAAAWSVNAGVYALEPSLLDRIDTSGPFHMTQLIGGALERRERVLAHPLEGDWLDIGGMRELRHARGEEL